MEIELTLKDRVLLLNGVLPQFDTRKNTELKILITEKLNLSTDEQNSLVCQQLGNGQLEVSFKTMEALSDVKAYIFSEEELQYLKGRIDFIDKNGMFSMETIDTYNKILEAETLNDEDSNNTVE